MKGDNWVSNEIMGELSGDGGITWILEVWDICVWEPLDWGVDFQFNETEKGFNFCRVHRTGNNEYDLFCGRFQAKEKDPQCHTLKRLKEVPGESLRGSICEATGLPMFYG